MIDPRFFKPAKSLSLGEIANLINAEVRYSGVNASTIIHDISSFDQTVPNSITFLTHHASIESLKDIKATACITSSEFVTPDLHVPALFITSTPKKAFAKLAHIFYPNSHITQINAAGHEAWPNVSIDPTAAIDSSVTIGAGTIIGPHVTVAKGVIIGENCVIHSHTSISHAIIGNCVTIHPGARIGQPGFGFIIEGSAPIDFPQLGRVIIEDNVRVGANTCIDRGTIKDTFIGQGARIDNLVQIAHNVHIGKGCVIVAQVGIAGSTEIGDYAILAGQAGISENLKIGKNVKIAAQSGVMRHIPDNTTVGGYPAVPFIEWTRQAVILSKLARGKK